MFSENLRTVRTAKGFSQQELAPACGTPDDIQVGKSNLGARRGYAHPDLRDIRAFSQRVAGSKNNRGNESKRGRGAAGENQRTAGG